MADHSVIEEQFSSFSDLQRKLDRVKHDWDACWYRGHREGRFDLLPKVFRPTLNHGDLYLRQEKNITQRFFQRVPTKMQEGEQLPHALPNQLCFAQHYELPTRILDWSDKLTVAIWFAVVGDAHVDNPCIWLIDPLTFNADMGIASKELGWRSDPVVERAKLAFHDQHPDRNVDVTAPACFFGQLRSQREEAQRARFSIHGTDAGSLNEIALNRHGEEAAAYLYKLTLPTRHVEGFKKEVQILIDREADLFPEPQAVARDVVREIIAEADRD